jgi:ankyrin repeat protein
MRRCLRSLWRSTAGRADATTKTQHGRGDDITTVYKDGLTALCLATKRSQENIVQPLVEKGADVTAMDCHEHGIELLPLRCLAAPED